MTNSRRLLALVVGVVILAITMHSAWAIKCYQCNSLYDKNCADLEVNDTTSQNYLKECNDSDSPKDARYFCRKIVQTVLYKENSKRTIRKCGFEKHDKPCYHIDDEDHAEVVCQCFDDACNSAPGSPGSPWRTALLAGTSTVLLRVLLL